MPSRPPGVSLYAPDYHGIYHHICHRIYYHRIYHSLLPD